MRGPTGRWRSGGRQWIGLAVLSVPVFLALSAWRALAEEEMSGDPMDQEETCVVLKSLQFKSDFTKGSNNRTAYLWDKTDKYADPEDPPDKEYSEPEWDWSHSYPIDHVKKVRMDLKLVFDVTSDKPGPLNYYLVGKGDAGYWAFFKKGVWPGPGVNLEIDDVLAAEALPDSVGILRDKQIHWTITINGEYHDLGNTGPHTVYRTYATPCDGKVTVKRAEACCAWAEGKKDPEPIADAIWNNIGNFYWQNGPDNDPPFEPGEKDTTLEGPDAWPKCWTLMDKVVAGECDEQAALMNFCCRLLGLSANTRLVHASSVGGIGKCLEIEPRTCKDHGQEMLLLASAAGPSNWNRFEGCCEVPAAGRYYAVWPAIKATDDYDMLKNKLVGTWGWKQYWTYMDENNLPVAHGGEVSVP